MQSGRMPTPSEPISGQMSGTMGQSPYGWATQGPDASQIRVQAPSGPFRYPGQAPQPMMATQVPPDMMAMPGSMYPQMAMQARPPVMQFTAQGQGTPMFFPQMAPGMFAPGAYQRQFEERNAMHMGPWAVWSQPAQMPYEGNGAAHPKESRTNLAQMAKTSGAAPALGPKPTVKRTGSGPSGRSCAKCGATSTPKWRRGEDKAILCNACGLQASKTPIGQPTQVPSVTNIDKQKTVSESGEGKVLSESPKPSDDSSLKVASKTTEKPRGVDEVSAIDVLSGLRSSPPQSFVEDEKSNLCKKAEERKSEADGGKDASGKHPNKNEGDGKNDGPREGKQVDGSETSTEPQQQSKEAGSCTERRVEGSKETPATTEDKTPLPSCEQSVDLK